MAIADGGQRRLVATDCVRQIAPDLHGRAAMKKVEPIPQDLFGTDR